MVVTLKSDIQEDQIGIWGSGVEVDESALRSWPNRYRGPRDRHYFDHRNDDESSGSEDPFNDEPDAVERSVSPAAVKVTRKYPPIFSESPDPAANAREVRNPNPVVGRAKQDAINAKARAKRLRAAQLRVQAGLGRNRGPRPGGA